LPGGSDLVVVGDVHLDRDDPDLRPFLADLRRLGATAGRVVLMGDLFNLWIGAPDLEQDHHRAVLGALREIRRSGVEVHYLEGNRDYRIAKAHLGDAFDSATDGGLDESWGGRRLFAAHGDLVNVRDRQYRAWRRASRSNAAWWLLSAIPRAQRFAFAERLERSMRATNLDQKAAFPDAEARAYAAPYFEKGYDAVLLGHFHVEKELVAVPPARPGRVYVLPEWKGTRRHLRVTAAGEIRFEGV
jgi:UDP-2,3-diacylglucosamine hydrolase